MVSCSGAKNPNLGLGQKAAKICVYLEKVIRLLCVSSTNLDCKTRVIMSSECYCKG